MKSRQTYADKDKDLPSSTSLVGAFRNSFIETSFAWATRAGNGSKGSEAVINVSSTTKIMFIVLLEERARFPFEQPHGQRRQQEHSKRDYEMLACDGAMDLGMESRRYVRSPGVEDGTVEK